jgi:hypothetical protein
MGAALRILAEYTNEPNTPYASTQAKTVARHSPSHLEALRGSVHSALCLTQCTLQRVLLCVHVHKSSSRRQRGVWAWVRRCPILRSSSSTRRRRRAVERVNRLQCQACCKHLHRAGLFSSHTLTLGFGGGLSPTTVKSSSSGWVGWFVAAAVQQHNHGTTSVGGIERYRDIARGTHGGTNQLASSVAFEVRWLSSTARNSHIVATTLPHAVGRHTRASAARSSRLAFLSIILLIV